MIITRRTCAYCGKYLHPALAPQARHCSDSHKTLASRQRVAAQARRDRFAVQEVQLLSCAPKGAAAYRLGIRRTDTGPLHFFPKRAGKGFALDPFQPPSVPAIGLYVVRYLDAHGHDLGTPLALVTGLSVVEIDPKTRF